MGTITRTIANNITTGLGGASVPTTFRNLIINGDMSVAQRPTTTGITNASGDVYVCDKFCWSESGGMTSTFTMSQDNDVPDGYGFAKSLKLDCTATDTPATNERIRIETRFEGQHLQLLKKGTNNAESFTLSFWVQSVKTGTYIVNFLDEDNTRHVSKAYTISSANTWEKKTMTVTPDGNGRFDNDNAHSLTIAWLLSAGSSLQSGDLADVWADYANANYAAGQVNFADNTNNNFFLTGVQLEAGTTASDFEFLPFDVTKTRCLRYYQKSYEYATAPGTNTTNGMHTTDGGAGGTTTGELSGDIDFKEIMRAGPTVTLYDKAGTSGKSARLRSGVARTDGQNGTAGDITQKGFTLTSTGTALANSIDLHFEAKADI
tara:strand:+ start:8342 stop:9469 length:1128 start_codon:yes stop_codon:yes gene_type:complete